MKNRFWKKVPRSQASGWSLLTTLWGFPCCVRFPCVHPVATTRAQRLGVLFALLHPCPFRGLLSVHSRTACTLALSPIRDTLIEGFSHFVTSMIAPIASGWSGWRVGLAPTGKRRLCTAHANSGHSPHPELEPTVAEESAADVA